MWHINNIKDVEKNKKWEILMRNKKKLWALQIIILAVICIIGCESDNDKPNMDFVYPLTVGNSWEYESTFTLDFDSLATYNGLNDTILYHTGSVEIIANEVIFDSLEVYNFASIMNENGYIFTGNRYYNNNDDGLFCYGHTNVSNISPKTNNNYFYIKFDNKIFNNIREIFNYIENDEIGNQFSKDDSIHYDLVKTLEYPLEEDNQWIYRTYDTRTDKTIIGWEEIDVPAGEFNCWKIQYSYPESNWDDDVEAYDFVSKDGLVKRFSEVKNLECIDEDGNFLGYLILTEERYLTDYQIID